MFVLKRATQIMPLLCTGYFIWKAIIHIRYAQFKIKSAFHMHEIIINNVS